jgi:hypothetical protein
VPAWLYGIRLILRATPGRATGCAVAAEWELPVGVSKVRQLLPAQRKHAMKEKPNRSGKYTWHGDDGTSIVVSGPQRVRALGLIQTAPDLLKMLEFIFKQCARYGRFSPTRGYQQEMIDVLARANSCTLEGMRMWLIENESLPIKKPPAPSLKRRMNQAKQMDT